MATYIKVNNTEYPAEINGNPKDRAWGDRDTKTIALTMTAAEVAALLPDNTPWSIVQRETVDKLDNDGQPTGETEEVVNEWDNSAYSLSGAITDHRDGTVSIKMGKPTETESAKATVAALAGEPVTYARAVKLRPIIEQAAVSLSDGEAASVPELITAWAYPVDYAEGDRRSYGGKVCKCRQAHTSQADWTPDKTPNLWAVIDAAHAGTQADPIPAARGMEYEYGKYYLDGEDGKTYKCERIGEAAGGKIVLQYLPHELAGQYFTEV
jgi:hypothetical protein|nr:MAG TPA: ChiA1-BD-binding domain protein [Caudoviricetes sp.]